MTLVDKIILNAEKSEYFKELFDKLEKLNYYSFLKSPKREQYCFSNKELNDILRFADVFASSDNAKFRNYANRIVSNLYEYYSDNEIYRSFH